MPEEVSWYGVRIVFAREASPPSMDDNLYEESIILVKTGAEAEARRNAERAGRSMRHTYQNDQGIEVSWRYLEILDLKRLLDDPIEEGTEIYYSFLSQHDLEALRAMLRSSLGER